MKTEPVTFSLKTFLRNLNSQLFLLELFFINALDIEIVSLEIISIHHEAGGEAGVSSDDGGGGGQFTETQAWRCEGLVATLGPLQKSLGEVRQAQVGPVVMVEDFSLEALVETELRK